MSPGDHVVALRLKPFFLESQHVYPRPSAEVFSCLG